MNRLKRILSNQSNSIAVLAMIVLMTLAGTFQAHSEQAAVSPPVVDLTPGASASLREPVTGFEQCRQFFPGELPRVSEQKTRRVRDLCYDAFAILYSGQTKTPIFAVERITRASLDDASDEKRMNRFFADARLPSGERAKLEDYKGSGYDRGHMAPAADMPTAQANDQSFSLANMVPQDRTNNQRTWAGIERATRHYVRHASGPVYVFTGPFYSVSPPQTAGPGHVWVPTHLYKLVYDPAQGKAWAHWIENTNTARAGQPISYEELVRRTHIEFLPGVALKE